MKGYPKKFLPWLVAAFVLLTVSGWLLVPTMLDLRFGWDMPWRLPGNQRVSVAALHSAFALMICGFAGALWSIHMRVGWRSQRHLISGPLTAGLWAGAAVTTIGVLYSGDEIWLMSASVGHTLLGTAGIVCGAAHWAIATAER